MRFSQFSLDVSKLVLNGPRGSDCLCTDCVPAVFQYLNTQGLGPILCQPPTYSVYQEKFKGNHSACKKGLCKALRLQEVASINSVQVPNITIMFELIYKSHRSLSGNPHPL